MRGLHRAADRRAVISQTLRALGNIERLLDVHFCTRDAGMTVGPQEIERAFWNFGGGEPTAAVVSSAISNAIYDAVGVPMRTVPFTPDKLLAALRM